MFLVVELTSQESYQPVDPSTGSVVLRFYFAANFLKTSHEVPTTVLPPTKEVI